MVQKRLTTRRLLRLASVLSAAVTVRSFAAPIQRAAATRRSTRPFSSSGQQLCAMASDEPPPHGSSGRALFLFDFDGVVCDSCDECTVSALRTCRKLGVLDDGEGDGEGDGSAPEYPPPWLFEKMREIRPAIEVGWQIPVLLSVFLEQQRKAAKPGGPGAMTAEEIIANYEALVDGWLRRWEKDEDDMIAAFGSVRDAWIADDMPSWLDINAFYSGVPESLSACGGEGILVTTKQQRFAVALCRHAGVGEAALPEDRIYGLGMYKKKSDVIADRMKAGGYAPGETRFFEDRWPTLAKCLKDDRLDGVRFYLCEWGYVTEGELQLARAEPRVEVIGLDDFARIVSS